MSDQDYIVNPNAPDYRTIEIGLSIRDKCNNQNCSLYNEVLVINYGYIVVELPRLLCDFFCLNCKQIITPSASFALGFYKCEWEIKSYTTENKKLDLHDREHSYKVVLNYPSFLSIKFATIVTKSLNKKDSWALLWIKNSKFVKKLKFPESTRLIKLLDYGDLFEFHTGIPKEHLGFYYNGKRVWKIDVNSTNCDNLLQIINISCNIVKTIRFRALMEDPVKTYLVSVESQTKTLYETLLLLSWSYSVKHLFKQRLRITHEKGEELSLDCVWEYFPDELVIDIDFAEIWNSTEVSVIYDDYKEETGFLFDLNTQTKDFKRTLSLFIETHEEKLEFNTLSSSIEKKTLRENNFEAHNHVIINYLKRGGKQSFNTMRVDPNEVIMIGPSNTAPNWRRVSKGFSWICKCNNSSCEAKGQPVIVNIGMGSFVLKKITSNFKCPKCSGDDLALETCGIYKAKYKYIGIDHARNHHDSEWTSTSDTNYHQFSQKKKDEEWIYFMIEVIEAYQ